MHLHLVEIGCSLVGAVAGGASVYLARPRRKATQPISAAGQRPAGLSRTEQHKFDSEHNPNYRGGYRKSE
jgi:hypothetical protein